MDDPVRSVCCDGNSGGVRRRRSQEAIEHLAEYQSAGPGPVNKPTYAFSPPQGGGGNAEHPRRLTSSFIEREPSHPAPRASAGDRPGGLSHIASKTVLQNHFAARNCAG